METETALDFMCRACGESAPAETFSIPDYEYDIVEHARYGLCQRCGSFTQHPMPANEALSNYYPASYHSFLPASILSRLRQKSRIKSLRLSAAPEDFHGTLLDFGCGQGIFLDMLAIAYPKGRFIGYEIDATNRREDRCDGRVMIFRGDPAFFWSEVPSIDHVTMNHVIEHLPDPLAVLATINDKLNPGGTLEGQTPNADGFERKVFGSRWSGFHSPRHTVVFSARGLHALLLKSGFTTVDVGAGFNPAGWAVSLGALLGGTRRPRQIQRKGLFWLMLVLSAIGPAFVEKLMGRSAITDFRAVKQRDGVTA